MAGGKLWRDTGSMITPLHTFAALFISSVCVRLFVCLSVYDLIYGVVSSALWLSCLCQWVWVCCFHNERKKSQAGDCNLTASTNHGQPTYTAGPRFVKPFRSGRDVCNIKRESPAETFILLSNWLWQKNEKSSRQHLEQTIDLKSLECGLQLVCTYIGSLF